MNLALRGIEADFGPEHVDIHGQTAAEVIVSRANASKERMGLTTWKDAPKGKIQKFDVVVAKNYLTACRTGCSSRTSTG